MEVNDKVVIKNDSSKVVYIIESISENNALIYGMTHRIKQVVSLDLLEEASSSDIEKEIAKTDKYYYSLAAIRKRPSKKYLLGKILHIDGDKEYLEKCIDLYEKLGIYAYGICIDEKKMALEVQSLVRQINPDIVVITGHDLYNGENKKDLKNYSNSSNYMDAVKKIREVKSKYDLAIVAGACQSNYEALIASGADFASSPKRINIHTFDPCVIAIKIATTSFLKVINFEEVYKYIENGKEAFGGTETLGKMRLIYD